MPIQILKPTIAKCSNCDFVQEVIWSEYGASYPCLECDSAPVYLEKIK